MNTRNDARELLRRAQTRAKLTEPEALKLANRETRAARRARKPVDLEKLRTLVREMPKQPEGAGGTLRRLRKQSRY